MTRDFKVSVSSILAVLIFLTQFVSLSYFTWYNFLRYSTIVAVGIYVFARYKILIQRKYLMVNILALLFSMLTIYTSFLNKSRGAERDPFLAAIVYCASFIIFLFYMEIMAEYCMVEKTIDVFYRVALIVAVITDMLVFFAPSLFAVNHQYFVGTKFGVVYLHLLLMVFYFASINMDESRKPNKKLLAFLAVWSFFVGIYVDCSTGILGVLILLAFMLIINNREGLFLNSVFYSAIQILSFCFVYFYEFVLSNGTVEHFIVNVLGRDMTLTYRTVIYQKVPLILTAQNGWMKGMGYGSSYELGMKYGGLSDTQNGILEWIWQVGVPTTIVMVIMFAVIFFISKRYMVDQNRKILLAFLSGIYLMTVLGTVEITISQMYFALLVCILGIATENVESNEIEDEIYLGETNYGEC